MKNIKFITICAASGFVLSLICGFFSKSGFGRIFLIALIFGIIFGGISFGISIVYDKFLAIETTGVENTTVSDGISSPDKKVLGQHIDLIIQEEPLEQSGNENHYDVGENHQMLNDSDYNNTAGGNQTKEENQEVVPKDEFVPIRNLETVNNFSSSESTTPAEAEQRRTVIAAQEAKKSEDLDVLPDMSDFKIASDEEGGEDDTVVLSDSEEGDFVSSVSSSRNSGPKDGEIKDASLMAKAISSILSEET